MHQLLPRLVDLCDGLGELIFCNLPSNIKVLNGYTLPETNWMLGIRWFPSGAWPILRGELLVSGRVKALNDWCFPRASFGT